MSDIREIVQIDEALCDGCGACIPSCAEGALEIVNGKARIIEDKLCDGLGACLGNCPKGALKIIHRAAVAFDETYAHEHVARQKAEAQAQPQLKPMGGCAGANVSASFTPKAGVAAPEEGGAIPSRLGHWPVQIKLVPADAPFLRGRELVVAADCAPVAFGDFHRSFLGDRAVMIGCPKFDDNEAYVQKFVDVFERSGITGLTVVRMEVPCCRGLSAIVQRALQIARPDFPVKEVVITRQGDMIEQVGNPAARPATELA